MREKQKSKWTSMRGAAWTGAARAGAGYYRDQLDVLEQEPAEGVTFEKSMIFCMFWYFHPAAWTTLFAQKRTERQMRTEQMQRAKRETESLRNSDDAKKRLQSCICWLCRLFRSGGWFSSISSTLNPSSAMCTFLRRSFLVIHAALWLARLAEYASYNVPEVWRSTGAPVQVARPPE